MITISQEEGFSNCLGRRYGTASVHVRYWARIQLQAEDKAISASKFCLTHRHQQCKRVLKTMNHVSSSQLSNLVPLYLDMYWWGTGSTAGLMFIALSLEPNDILCIILLPIANQALPFQSTFQTGSRVIIFFFFCMWHLFIPCAKTGASDLRAVKLDHSFRNNSLFFSPSVYESGLH